MAFRRHIAQGLVSRGRCLELLGIAELAVRVENLRSKDIVVLPEEQELEEKYSPLRVRTSEESILLKEQEHQ